MDTATLCISPWGNSHGIRFSQELMQAMGITPEVKLNPSNLEVGVTPKDSGLPEVGGMYTEDQVRAIVQYERSLSR